MEMPVTRIRELAISELCGEGMVAREEGFENQACPGFEDRRLKALLTLQLIMQTKVIYKFYEGHNI